MKFKFIHRYWLLAGLILQFIAPVSAQFLENLSSDNSQKWLGEIVTDNQKNAINNQSNLAIGIQLDAAAISIENNLAVLYSKPFTAPIANDDNYTIAEDNALTVSNPAFGLLANDSDPDLDNLTVNLTPLVAPSNGILNLNADGTFDYTPTANFSGVDSFQYEVCDDAAVPECSSATVTITVTAENDAPIADNDVAVPNAIEDTPYNGSTVLVNDVDIDLDALSVDANPVSGPAHGSVLFNADGTYTYLPQTNYFGNDTFSYRVCDAGTPQLCAIAIVSIVVDAQPDAPVAMDDSYTTDEDVSLNGNSVLLNDLEVDAEFLTVNTTPVVAPLHGNITLTAGGTFTYVPDANYNGSDSFVYEVCDNGIPSQCAQATVSITINPINDLPIAIDDNNSTTEDTPLNGSTVLSNDSDPDNDPLTVATTPVTNVAHGTLTLNANGTYFYMPAADYNGPDSFVYSVCDNQIPAGCSQATVNLNVTAINDNPTAVNDSYTLNEDNALNASSLLLNDFDVDGNNLLITTIPVSSTLHGNLTINPNGTFSYIPDANYFGPDSFVYQVCDDGTPVKCANATVNLTINAINDNPIAVNDVAATNEDQLLNGTSVLTNDSDVDNLILNVNTVPLTAPTHGILVLNANGTYTYTPALNYNGPDSFVYQVCDNAGIPLCASATVNITINPLNDAPVANNDVASTNEDIILNGATVLANDSDPDGNPLTVSTTALVNPAHGSLILNSNGTYSFTPAANYNGPDSFVYEVCDNGTPALCSSATVNITINAVPDAPIATNDSYTLNEDGLLNGASVLVNDTDGDGDVLTVNTTPVTNVTNGLLVLNSDGTFIYIPAANYNGTDSFVYQVCDGTAACSNGTVILTINAVNDPPVAGNDVATVSEDGILNGASVLLNDSDPEGNTLSVSTTPLVLPAHGSVTLNSNGTYTYLPAVNYNGPDSFQYQVCDNGVPSACSSAMVTITINPINDPPTVVNDSYTTNEDQVLNAASVLGNDSDIDGNGLAVLTSPVSGPSNGLLVLNSNGTFTYTPNANFNGSDSFVYRVCDNGTPSLCINGTVTITINSINDLPVAVNDVASTSEDNVLNGSSVLINDSDVDGNPLTVSALPAVAPLHGSVSLNSNGTYVYTPALNYNGPDSFVYQVCDNASPAGCSTATVNITVSAVNDAPTAVVDSYSIAEDQPLNGTTILVNDSDIDGDAISVNTSPVTAPTHGSLTLNANGTFTYIPALNYFGPDSFVYSVCDNGTPVLCSTTTVSINVTAVNDAPIAVSGNYSTSEDVTLNGSSVLANDSDPDGDALTVNTTPVVNVSSGTLTLNSNGTFVYVPAPNFNGSVSFVYQVCDNAGVPLCATATTVIDVLSVNDAPNAVADNYSTNEDTPLNGSSVLANDNDVEGNTLTVNTSPISLPAHGALILNPNGTFTYTPNPNYNGPDSFVYQVCDNGTPSLCSNATVSLTVISINDAPVAVDDNATTLENITLNGTTVLANDLDPEGGILTVNTVPITNVLHGTLTLNSNGTYTYIPNTNYNGFDSFVYQVCDNGTPQACATATVIISIGAVNQFPIAVNDVLSTNEDTPNSSNVLGNDSDPDLDQLTVTAQTNFPTAHGKITIAANGAYTYSPNLNYNGTDSYTYQVCDNGSPVLCSNAVLNITVNAVNDAPVAVNDNVTTPEDSPLNGSSLLINDSDVDGNPLTLSLTPLVAPTHGTLQLNSNGTYLYTPAANYIGGDTFVYEVCDNAVPPACSNAVVLITITAVNDAPTAVNDAYTLNEDAVLNASTVLANDFDLDGNALQVTGIPLVPPAHGNLVINANGTFIFTPAANYNGTDSFVYEVCDNAVPSLCSSATVNLTINPTNDAPVALANNGTTAEDTPLSGSNLLSNDFDVDGNTLTINTSPAVNPLHGTVVINPNGTYLYTPASNYNGPDSFSYQVCDNGTPILCATAVVSLTVTAVNDAPIAIQDVVGTNEDVLLNGTTVLSNDSDPDGNPLLVTSTPLVAPLHGNLVLNSNGTYSYQPNLNYNGSDSFVYEVCDNGTPALCSSATVTITINPVNDAPLAVNDIYSVQEDNSLTATSLLLNDSDPESGILVINTIPVSGPSHGTLSINANGTFLYTPAANYNGSDSFVYQVCDAGIPIGCATATATITISAINDAPIAVDDNASTLEGVTLNGQNLILNDSDPDGNLLSINTVPVTAPTNGLLVIQANGTYTYTPNSGFSGFDSFVYSVCDNGSPVLCDNAIVTIGVGAVNHPPLASADVFSTLENVPVSGNLSTNDTDPDGNNLIYATTALVAPTNGNLTINANGTFTYSPNPGFSGSDGFTYRVCDNGSPVLCATASVTITIIPVNDKPSVNKDVYSTNEDQAINSFSLLLNDTDPDGNNLTVNTTPVSAPLHGTLSLSANGNFIYTPAANYFGSDSFIYQACDNGSPSLCDTAIVQITIVSVNDAPIAINDFFSTSQNTAVSGNVASNDSDVDHVNLTCSVLNNVSNGSLLLNANGTFTYTPGTNFIGKDTLTYLICDGGTPALCDTAILVITISTVPNAAPIANSDVYQVNEDTQLTTINSILVNDSDPNGNIISLDLIPVIAPSNGSLTLQANGNFTYIPNLNFSGIDQFVYQICDDGTPSLCDTAMVFITVVPVNDAPEAVNDTLQTLMNLAVNGNTALNDIDVDGPTYTASLLAFPSNGSVVYNANGTFNYTPTPNFIGTDSFIYSVCDGGSPDLCAVATVVIHVNALPPNQAPVALGDFFTTNEDVQISGTLTANDVDPEGSVLVYNSYSGPIAHGTLALSTSGNFIYVPAPNYFGADSFIYTVCDTSSPALCDTALLRFQVNPVNDAPVAINDSATIIQGTTASGNVLTNDGDVESALLTASLLVAPINGIAVINSNGNYTYTPNPNFIGTEVFSYLACDGGTPVKCDTALVVVTVNPPACAGYEANADFALTSEDFQVIISALSNDAVISSNLTVGIVQTTLNGTLQQNANNTFTYTPNPNFFGTDSFVYSLGRNTGGPSVCDTAIVNIDVLSVNDAPVAVDDAFNTTLSTAVSGNVLLNDLDVDDPLLTSTLVNNVSNGTLTFNSNGTFTYTPNAGFLGTDTFTYSICDGAVPPLCDTAIVVITVSGQICAGYIASADEDSLNEDGNLILMVQNNDTINFPNAGIVITQSPIHGTVVVNANNTITYTAPLNYFGNDIFIYGLTDTSLPGTQVCDTAIVHLFIRPVNDGPSAIPESFTMNEGTVLSDSVFANDSDVDSDSLIWSVVTQPVHGSLVFNADGTFTYSPSINFVGLDTFVYQLCDTGAQAICATALVTINVLKVNKAPFAVDDTASVNQGEILVRNVLGNDSDPDFNDFITVSQVTQGAKHGVVLVATDGTFTYTPDELYFGVDSFAYEVCDDNINSKLCDEAMVRITIREVPFSIPDAFSPDGDNINDLFVIKQIRAFPNNEFKVYNRWGHLVYQKKGYDNTWNGKSNVGAEGDGLPSGSYYYTLEFNDGITKTEQGYIVIRK